MTDFLIERRYLDICKETNSCYLKGQGRCLVLVRLMPRPKETHIFSPPKIRTSSRKMQFAHKIAFLNVQSFTQARSKGCLLLYQIYPYICSYHLHGSSVEQAVAKNNVIFFNWQSKAWQFLQGRTPLLKKNLPAMQETWVRSLGWEDSLEKGKATHSSILTQRIPWTVQTMGSQRVGHDCATFTFTPFLKFLEESDFLDPGSSVQVKATPTQSFLFLFKFFYN